MTLWLIQSNDRMLAVSASVALIATARPPPRHERPSTTSCPDSSPSAASCRPPLGKHLGSESDLTVNDVALDSKGGFLIESERAAARVYVHETDEGGLYFEVAMERGGRIYPSPEASRSALCTITPEPTS